MKTIEVFTRNVYGVHKIYPANAAALTLAQIAGTKTLSGFVIEKAVALGLTIVQVEDPEAPKGWTLIEAGVN